MAFMITLLFRFKCRPTILPYYTKTAILHTT